MRKISTLTYIIKTYQNDLKNEEILSGNSTLDFNGELYEPSPESIDAILNFARSYNVLNSTQTGPIELNLN